MYFKLIEGDMLERARAMTWYNILRVMTSLSSLRPRMARLMENDFDGVIKLIREIFNAEKQESKRCCETYSSDFF
jgi:hypothetical protein